MAAGARNRDPRSRYKHRPPSARSMLDSGPSASNSHISVHLHPVSSLVGLIAWQLSASKEARMDQPTQELHIGRRFL